MKKIIIDLDNTLTLDSDNSYRNMPVNKDAVEVCHRYKKMGFDIVIFSSRNMRTFDGNIGKINKHTLPDIIFWLSKNNIPYDEIYVGKPWCGKEGFYVDDKAIRPSEFVSLSYEEIKSLLANEPNINGV